MEIKELHQLYLSTCLVDTDTRNIRKGSIFFALKGDNFNGNIFAQQALENGARFSIVDEEAYAKGEQIILVEDVLSTLQNLANFHRKFLNIPVIGLTGSNGKTTTKELMYGVLKTSYKAKSTLGNLNNHIGVPLTLLSFGNDTEIGIVEMGANHQKEIEFLSNIAEPDFGYITNFGKAHIEGFGSIQGVIQGKSELYKYITKEKGTLFFNADDPIQNKLLGNYPAKVGFSQTKANFYTLKKIDANPYVALQIAQTNITSKLIGAYNFTNICAGALIGNFFDIPLKDIKQAIPV